jgi:hypothetical protein
VFRPESGDNLQVYGRGGLTMTKRFQDLWLRLRRSEQEEARDEAIERLARIVAAEARRTVRVTPLTVR